MTSFPHWLKRLTASTTAGGLLLLAAPGVVAQVAPPERSHQRLALVAQQTAQQTAPAQRRRIVHYRVRPGDTATGLAVRFHAWTDELLKMNHLTPRSILYVGQRLRIPVVRAADRADRPRRHKHRSRPKAHRPTRHHAPPSRALVRRTIIRSAHRHGVNPHLALAIAWQESGWQMNRVSSANAIGAMQVLPGTGEWMSQVVGRRLHLRKLHDNVTAGVVLIKLLRGSASRRHAIAGYYQGLAGVRRHGMYPSTKRYVANVLALKRAIERGWNPA